MTLVSVITPTWQRHSLLFERCMASVRAQTWPKVEHVIVSDGPDLALAAAMVGRGVVYAELDAHDPHPENWGSAARNLGLSLATGELVAYLDDDNEYRPQHLARLVDALVTSPEADFAWSRMLTSRGYEIGSAPPAYGTLDSSLLMHRAGLPQRCGMWPAPGTLDCDQHAPDWWVVSRWLAHGAGWVHVPEVTVDYHFSR
jgi:glycosyltransferase involved in cell wall biosynthesis